MAQKRMFSVDITSSDAFLDMPHESQSLYFHLGMSADDDGFVGNSKMIQRAIRVNDDSLKLLIAKKFLIAFPNGLCVVKHWRVNNLLRKHRYKETKYADEKASLFIRENGSYTQNSEGALPVPRGHFILDELFGRPLDDQRATIGRHRIGKVSIGKDRIEDTIDHEKQFDEFWKTYPRKVSKSTAFKKWMVIKPDEELFKKIISSVENYKRTEQWSKDKGKFIPHATTWLNQSRWEDEIDVKEFSASGASDKFKNIGKKI